MIWERWEEAARVIAKAGLGTWTGGGQDPHRSQGQHGGQEAASARERSREMGLKDLGTGEAWGRNFWIL